VAEKYADDLSREDKQKLIYYLIFKTMEIITGFSTTEDVEKVLEIFEKKGWKWAGKESIFDEKYWKEYFYEYKRK
jgi:hypothetical protein